MNTHLVLIALTLVATVRSSGMLLHMDVTDRALNSFKPDDPTHYPYEEVLAKHRSYVQAGSPFPDWGYLCNTGAGEASHWPPFVDAYIEYMQTKYAKGTE